jgi:hypothetical protein
VDRVEAADVREVEREAPELREERGAVRVPPGEDARGDGEPRAAAGAGEREADERVGVLRVERKAAAAQDVHGER